MDESCIYEGMRAVCAVLAELEAAAPERPALRLAERHLHLLAELAARETAKSPAGGWPSGEGAPAEPLAGAGLNVPAPEGARHVLQ
ncbi:MAG: hypothetical protein K2G99_04210 [Desulfovibrio sp.]|nr:hypothetical protein [Desulfovibrio sp.]